MSCKLSIVVKFWLLVCDLSLKLCNQLRLRKHFLIQGRNDILVFVDFFPVIVYNQVLIKMMDIAKVVLFGWIVLKKFSIHFFQTSNFLLEMLNLVLRWFVNRWLLIMNETVLSLESKIWLVHFMIQSFIRNRSLRRIFQNRVIMSIFIDRWNLHSSRICPNLFSFHPLSCKLVSSHLHIIKYFLQSSLRSFISK